MDALRQGRPLEEVVGQLVSEGGLTRSWDIFGDLGLSASQEISRPRHLSALFSELRGALGIGSALDPYAVSPTLLGCLAGASEGGRFLGISPREDVARAARLLSGPNLEWRSGRPDEMAAAIDEDFDWIVSSPPINARIDPTAAALPPGLGIGLVRREAGLLPIALALRPTTKGILVLMGEGFLWREDVRGWRTYLADQGLQMAAVVSVTEGLAPYSTIPTALCLFNREAHGQLFVARLTPTTDTAVLASNLAAHREAKVPELGALVDVDSFTGWSTFVARRSLEDSLTRSRVSLVKLGQISMGVVRGTTEPGADPEAKPNSLYFDARVLRTVQTSPPTPAENARTAVPFFEVELDPARADADYLAHWLNGDVGKLSVQSVAVGSAQKRIPKDFLELIRVPLPPLATQSAVVKLVSRLSGLRRDVEVLETRLTREPWNVAAIEDEVARLGESDPLLGWVESLPFPLAATVMRYIADADEGAKVQRLLHFFESFAEFGAIVLLSALRRHDDLWEQEWESIRRPGPNGERPALEAGTFGGWLQLGQHLAKVFRVQMAGPVDDDRRRALLGVASAEFVDALLSRPFWAALGNARPYRNTGAGGHGGAPGRADTRRRLDRLEALISELQAVTDRMFRRVVLVRPGDSARENGVRRYRRAQHLRGPLTTFVQRELVTQAHVDLMADGLSFVDQAEVVEDALELLPLVQLRPSPETEENAAFFFNRMEAQAIKFVSYHFPGEAIAPLDDPGLAVLFRDLVRPDD